MRVHFFPDACPSPAAAPAPAAHPRRPSRPSIASIAAANGAPSTWASAVQEATLAYAGPSSRSL